MNIKFDITGLEKDITDTLGQYIKENINVDNIKQMANTGHDSNLQYLDEYIEVVVRRVLKDLYKDVEHIGKMQRYSMLWYGKR